MTAIQLGRVWRSPGRECHQLILDVNTGELFTDLLTGDTLKTIKGCLLDIIGHISPQFIKTN